MPNLSYCQVAPYSIQSENSPEIKSKTYIYKRKDKLIAISRLAITFWEL